jgi:peptide-methionine (S)-S-oxide reductase
MMTTMPYETNTRQRIRSAVRLGAFAIAAGAIAAWSASSIRSGIVFATDEGRSKMSQKAMEETATSQTAQAIFAAGCFWGVEETFRQTPGVVSTEVGYTGGHFANPKYEEVCSDKTGHAEAVRVTYDPSRTSYDRLLDVFWNNHNPTTPNRQGPDVGSQYRSAIFYLNEDQRLAAEASKKRLEESRAFARPIVTEIAPASEFYRAEEYHQQYLEKRGLANCHK